MGNPAAFQVQNFTIEAWIKRANATSISQSSPAAGIFAGGDGSYTLTILPDGRLILGKVNVSNAYSTGGVKDTNWHHVAVTKDGTNVAFYVDGVPAGTTTYAAVFDFKTPFTIGSLGGTFGGYNYTFWGLIDELSLYDQALSGAEISSIYAAGADGKNYGNSFLVLKGDAPQRVAAGTDFKANFFLENNGLGAATNVVLSVALPAGYALVSASASSGSNVVNATQVQNLAATLAPGETIRLTLTGYGDAPASLTFRGRVAYDGGLTRSPEVTVSTVESIGSFVPDGIVGWWRAEGDNQDVFRNGTTNATSATVGGASFVPGFVNRAFSFGGGLIGVLVGNPAAFQQQDLTIEAWVKRASASSANSRDTVASGTIFSGGIGSYGLRMLPTGELTFGQVGGADVFSTAKIKDTLWHHVAVTRQSTNVNFYLDGSLAGSAAYAATFSFTTPFAVGSVSAYINGPYNTIGSFTFWGLIDEVSLYRRPLSGVEIAAIFASQSNGKRAENIVLSMAAVPAVQPGTDFNVTFSVFNAGLDMARNVALDANLPAGLVVAGSSASQGENAIVGTALHASLGALLPGDSAIVSVTGHANVPATLAFDGQITRSDTDLSLVDNQAGVTVEILPPCAPIPTDGLVVWLPGEGNANDVAGSHPVSYSGQGYVPGRVNQAFDFDGTSQLSIPDSPDLDLASFTVEAWVFPTKVDGSVDTIVSKELYPNAASQIQFILAMKGPSSSLPNTIPVGNLMFYVSGISGAFTPGFGSYSDAKAAIPLNQWTHVALSLGSGTFKTYVNGVVTFERKVTKAPIFNTAPLRIGARDPAFPLDRFNGRIDEFSYYSRALTDAEIRSIYDAGGTGKCPLVVAPSIVSAPTNQTAQVGTDATFSVVAQGTGPFTYQWKFKGADIAGATNATLNVSVQSLSDAGTYGVTVCNAAGCAPSVTANLLVFAPVSVVNTSAQSLQDVEVPIRLIASGLEHAFSFSLQFDSGLLTYLETSLGTDVAGGQIQVDTVQAAHGILGVSLTLPIDGTLVEGTNDLLHLRFGVSSVAVSLTTPITFASSPVPQKISNTSGTSLPVIWVNGSVTIAARGSEGDVTPLPDGDQLVNATDTAQVGRYVAGLDDLSPGVIFQRADSAPLATSGNGVLSVSDWVQVARFAAGRDLPGPTGGPAAPQTFTPTSSSPDRLVHLDAGTPVVEQTQEIQVLLDASGEENAAGFSVAYDPAKLEFVDAVKGSGSLQANLNVNARLAANGKVGLALSLNVGSRFPAGPVEIARLRFRVVGGASASLTFDDAPVVREVASQLADSLPVSWQGTSLVVTPPIVNARKITTPDGPAIELTWPASLTGAVLEKIDTLGGTWSPVATAPTVSDGQNKVVVPLSEAAAYFHLKLP